MCKTV